MKKYTEVLAQIETAREEMKHAQQEIENADKAYSNNRKLKMQIKHIQISLRD